MSNKKTTKTDVSINEMLGFNEEMSTQHGLQGHVQLFLENKLTGEKTLWYENHNIIPISGYSWILMKMFGLHLDSNHAKNYEDIGKDTTLVIPDLNDSGAYQLGIAPSDYSTMEEEISANHFIQGFMVGNGGSGEDGITTKNTDYSFTKLRSPIPFQQTQTSLSSDIAGQYLGMLRVGSSSFSKSYYIKKFDETPHIYHSWYREGQKWDYVDPVTQNDLGPNAVNGTGKTNRIESYCECRFTIEDTDCQSYFSHEGSNQTASINELGLVAYDAVYGTRSIIERLYSSYIVSFLKIIFDNNNRTDEMVAECIEMAGDISEVLSQLTQYGQSNINEFISTVDTIAGSTPETINFTTIQNALISSTNIEAEAYYNQNGSIMYTMDKFLTYLSDSAFDTLTTDEAQRIKLVTYYTFNSIPLQDNFRVLVRYRIIAN